MELNWKKVILISVLASVISIIISIGLLKLAEIFAQGNGWMLPFFSAVILFLAILIIPIIYLGKQNWHWGLLYFVVFVVLFVLIAYFFAWFDFKYTQILVQPAVTKGYIGFFG